MILLFIFLSFWLGLSWKYSWIVLGIVALATLIFLLLRFNKKVFLLGSCAFFIGFGVSYVNVSFNKKIYTGVVVEAKDNYIIFESSFEKLYVYEKGNKYEIGDILSIEGKKEELDFSVIESQFNFKNYLNKKGIYKELIPNSIEIKFSNFFRMKSYRKWFLSHFDEETSSLVSAILFSNSIDSELRDDIESMHLTRLISASGLYVYAFINILQYFLRKKFKEKWVELISLGILSIYFVFTFPRFAILKIVVVSLFRWINNYLLKRRFSYFEVLAISGFAFLLFDYHLAYQDGFILGYLIPIAFTFIRKIYKNKKSWIQKLITPCVIYLFFIPFEIRYYHSLSPLSVLYQTVFSPYFILIAIISLISFYGLPIYKLIEWMIYPLKWIFKGITSLNLEIYALNMNDFGTLFYYVIFFVAAYYISIRFKPFTKWLIPIYISYICCYLVPVKNSLTAEVNFINVGQGDCCLIRNAYTTIMIDTGGLKYMDVAKDSLIPYLKKKQIYQLDLVITTHEDNDHSGTLPSLRENFRVKKYINSYTEFPINIGGLTLVNYNTHISEKKDENDKSLVIGFSLLHKDFLIMGDAPIGVELEIMKENRSIPCDILKVGHHGSDTSSCNAFIQYLNPDVAIISCGKNNSYGHPHDSVIRTLKMNNVTIRRTDIEGTIVFQNYIFM